MNEHQLQASIMAEVNLLANQHPDFARIFAVPNGGDRNVIVAAKLKAEGVRAGVPDLMWLLPSRGYNGLVMELKVGRRKPTQEQVEWLHWLSCRGFYTCVVHDDASAAVDILKWYYEGGIDA